MGSDNVSNGTEDTLRNPAVGSPETPTQIGSPATAANQRSQIFDIRSLSQSIAVQDLSGDKLLMPATRIPANTGPVPSFSGIPLLSKLGQGGMGAVYLGYHLRLNKEVAVKVLPFLIADQSPDAVKRFFREAQLAAKVQSPHLVAVLDVNEENGLFYIVMEYVNGLSASGCLKQARKANEQGLSQAIALEICIAATKGLAEAHENGVIHRDVKPDNIMVPKNNSGEMLYSRAKLADLGLARAEAGDQSITASQVAMGTPGYMPPEQAKSAHNALPASDVFAMGATLYALLSGRPPFGGDSPMDTLLATLQTSHKPIRELCPQISIAVSEVLDVCLSKDPKTRYASAKELLEALENCRAISARKNVESESHSKTVVGRSKPGTGIEKSAGKQRFSVMRLSIIVILLTVLAGVGLLIKSNSQANTTVSKIEREKDSAEVARSPKQSLPEPTNVTAAQVSQVQSNFPREISIKLGADVGLEMVLIPAGEFMMGSPDSEIGREQSEGPQRKVKISKPFYMGKYEVTQEQWVAVMSENPSSNKDKPQHPVENVSWFDAREFLKRSKQPLALPTEAQWEWACRSGTTSRFHSGDDLGTLNSVAWVGRNASNATSPVGLKSPNNFGLYDMHGNVWEWCEDSFASYASLGEIDPVQREGNTRVLRGGSWRHPPEGCRSAYRRGNDPVGGGNIYAYGFRVVAPTTIATSSGQIVGTSRPILDSAKWPPERTIDLGGSFKLKLVLVPSGEFEMGSDSRGLEERPQHSVKITRPFYIGKYEVTREQYEAFAETTKYATGAEKLGKGFTALNGDWSEGESISWRNPGFTQGPDHPACVINFYDAEAFCAWLSWKSGLIVRIPTEAEWEYAARGTTNNQFPFGREWDVRTSGNTADHALKTAGFGMRFGSAEGNDLFPFTAPVGSFSTAASWCGTFDQAGNVWEWISDRYKNDYYLESPRVDPRGPKSGSQRIIRGGSWSHAPSNCVVSNRKGHDPEHCSAAVGFRVIVEAGNDVERIKGLQQMPPVERLRAIGNRLKTESLDTVGSYEVQKSGASPAKLQITNGAISSLDLVRDMREQFSLELVNCQKIKDLGPLAGIHFSYLGLYKTNVSTLEPLRYSAITHGLDISHTQVSDLSPLIGKEIAYLSIGNTPIQSIRALRDIRVRKLHARDSLVKDWTPLKDTLIEELDGDWTWEKDGEFLRSLKNLKKYNGVAVEKN